MWRILVVTKVFLVLLVCFCASRLEIFQIIASSVSFVTDASQNEAQCFLEVETFNKPSSCFLKGAGHGTETGRTVMTSQGGETTNTTQTAASNEQHQATAERSSARAKRSVRRFMGKV